jgi:hypothetical protein
VLALYLFLFLGITKTDPGSVHGTVRDANNGELLSQVVVQIAGLDRRVATDHNGSFDLTDLAPGKYILLISTVGYGLRQQELSIRPGERVKIEAALAPDVARQVYTVHVRADPFELSHDGGPTGFTLTGSEAKNLASVLADDPMRALQAVPGVSSNDDFDARFSLHGAPFERVGLFLDGILLHQPFHTVQGEGPSGSLAIFNGDLLETMSLESEAYPVRYGDRTAGILDVQTREGNRDEMHFRGTVSAPDVGGLAEGPIGSAHRGSWIVSARKSYLQYLLRRAAADAPSLAFGFTDVQGQASYDLNSNNHVSIRVLDGTSDFDRSSTGSLLPLNTAMLGRYRSSLANLSWQYTPNSSFVVGSHAAYIRERYENTNRDQNTIATAYYSEWVAKSDAAWMINSTNRLQFGVSARATRGDGFSDFYVDSVRSIETGEHRGNALISGGYVQHSWTGLSNHLSLSAGLRFDHLDVRNRSVALPQAALAYFPWKSSRIELSWGQYAQFPDIHDLASKLGGPDLRPERSNHYVIAVEQRLGLLGRFRMEAYRREDRELLFQPMEEARFNGQRIIPDNFRAPIMNSLWGTSQGLEFILQKRTANGLTGWISYALGYANMQDRIARIRFPSDQDQRHTVNAYASYRIRPTVNLIGKWSYGSGFPIPGFFEKRGSDYYISAERNRTRIDPYLRADFRINKSYAFEKWKLTVYGEVVNILNHDNYRFDSYNGYNPKTGQAYLSFSKMFPVLPSAGVAFDF